MAREFGPEIAVPVREAVAKTPGLVLVRSLPIDPEITTLILGTYGDKKVAYAPGGVLFVAFEQPTYDAGEMNNKMEVLVGNITDGRVASKSKAMVLSPRGLDSVDLSYITFDEETDPILRQTKTTDVYSANNPFVQSLLRNTGLPEQPQTYETEQTYHVTRTSYAALYPSVLFANVAAEFKQYHDMIRGTSEPRLSIWFQGRGGGMMTLLGGSFFRELAAADADHLSLEQVVSKYIPPKALVSV